jgi:hypothetical protein
MSGEYLTKEHVKHDSLPFLHSLSPHNVSISRRPAATNSLRAPKNDDHTKVVVELEAQGRSAECSVRRDRCAHRTTPVPKTHLWATEKISGAFLDMAGLT